MCQQAADYARKKVLNECKSVGLTSRLTIRRIKEGLNALENKVFYDKDRGRCVVGPDMVNYAARAKAIDQSISILELQPATKLELSGNLNIYDKLKEARERAARKHTTD
ncbi:MAG TPA: hypothetical protein DDY86_06730 [Syntrophaceae bacterium]|nr:hypothetical protein [Syntrophaceae bacterium]